MDNNMLRVNENVPLAQIAGLGHIVENWAIITDSRRWSANPKDYFDRKLTGAVYALDQEANAALASKIGESLYQLIDAYEDELTATNTDIVAARFEGHESWFWVIGETNQGAFYLEVLDILENSLPHLHPLYTGPLDFTRQKFWGLNLPVEKFSQIR